MQCFCDLIFRGVLITDIRETNVGLPAYIDSLIQRGKYSYILPAHTQGEIPQNQHLPAFPHSNTISRFCPFPSFLLHSHLLITSTHARVFIYTHSVGSQHSRSDSGNRRRSGGVVAAGLGALCLPPHVRSCVHAFVFPTKCLFTHAYADA